jgi:hypothetical protein
MTASSAAVRNATLAAIIDVVLVFVFVVIGRRSHNEGLTLLGTAETWWPFLVGLAVGWLVARAWRKPLGVLLPGVPLWLSTVVIGLLLRLVTGQTAQLPFVIVAIVVLAAFLIGWRALAAGFRRIRRSPDVL